MFASASASEKVHLGPPFLDTTARRSSGTRQISPVSPALHYQRGESSRSAYSNGSTISAYRPEGDRALGVNHGESQGQESMGLRDDRGSRQRLPYSLDGSPVHDGEADEARLTGSGEARRGHDGHSQHASLFTGVHRKDLRRSGWISRPAEQGDEWIRDRDEVTEWLPLFYDLIVVAVLGTFTTQHEVGTPSAIPIFLSFFTIIFWTWCSQTAYDMRFQGNDSLHRFFKFLQVCLFIYQGAASGKWNPGRIEVWSESLDEGDYGARLAVHRDALRSWLTVVVAFAVSRGLLMLQYGICAWQGRKIGRPVKHIILTMTALAISLVLAVISAAVPSTLYSAKVAKIAIFYLAIVVEVADGWVQVLLKISPAIPTHKIGERYGAFLLIVIGEGIIMISRSFNKAISGLSENDTGTYLQVFLTILVVYLLWAFLFGNFDKDDHTGSGRAAVWQTLHFPLTFAIMLLMAGMVNVVVVTSSVHGLSLVLDDIGDVANITIKTGSVPVESVKRANRYMYKLALEPPLPTEIEALAQLQQEDNPTDDWYIVLDQYVAQVVYNTFDQYGVDIPDSAQVIYAQLFNISTTWTADNETQAHHRAEADELLTEFAGDVLIDSFTGILWLLPVAGAVLILSALRSMAWYRFTGIAHYLVHLPQLIFGVALCLLGLLDIGPKTFNINNIDADGNVTSHVNPLYRVLFDEAPLVIVAVVYFVVWLITVGSLWWVDRKERARVSEQRREVERQQRERHGEGDLAMRELRRKEGSGSA